VRPPFEKPRHLIDEPLGRLKQALRCGIGLLYYLSVTLGRLIQTTHRRVVLWAGGGGLVPFGTGNLGKKTGQLANLLGRAAQGLPGLADQPNPCCNLLTGRRNHRLNPFRGFRGSLRQRTHVGRHLAKPPITPTIVPICHDEVSIVAMKSIVSLTTAPNCSASANAFTTMVLASHAPSVLLRKVVLISSIVFAASSKVAAFCSIRRGRSFEALVISLALIWMTPYCQ
jgi:hypothetical protein